MERLVQNIRKAVGMSAAELGRRMGVPTYRVDNFENGGGNLTDRGRAKVLLILRGGCQHKWVSRSVFNGASIMDKYASKNKAVHICEKCYVERGSK